MNYNNMSYRKLMLAIISSMFINGYAQIKIPAHTKNVVRRMERKAERKTEKEATKKMNKGIENGINRKKEDETKVDSAKTK